MSNPDSRDEAANNEIARKNLEVQRRFQEATKAAVRKVNEEEKDALTAKFVPQAKVCPQAVIVVINQAAIKREEAARLEAARERAKASGAFQRVQAPKKGRKPSMGPKNVSNGQGGKDAPIRCWLKPTDHTQSIIRTLDNQAEPLIAKDKNGDAKTPIMPLRTIAAEREALSAHAFVAAQKNPNKSAIEAPLFGGVHIKRLNPEVKKDAARMIPVPNRPTWVLYSDNQVYPIPRDFPSKSYVMGVDLVRVQAAFISKMMIAGLIDAAILALPVLADELKSEGQWFHEVKKFTTTHTSSQARILPTSEQHAFHGPAMKEEKKTFFVTVRDAFGETTTGFGTGDESDGEAITNQGKAKEAAMQRIEANQAQWVRIRSNTKLSEKLFDGWNVSDDKCEAFLTRSAAVELMKDRKVPVPMMINGKEYAPKNVMAKQSRDPKWAWKSNEAKRVRA